MMKTKMEAIQSYYLNKPAITTNKEKHKKEEIMLKSILWAKESIRILLNDINIQQKILLDYFPQFKQNIQYMKIFDSIDLYEIKSYIEQMIHNPQISGIIVLVIANYQIILLDKTLQDVYIIDPTSMLRIKSIHDITYLEENILPIFKQNKYNIEHVQLSYPAQNSHTDPYSHTWLLYLLIECLDQLYRMRTISIIMIPDKTREKNNILSDFHKNILSNKQIKNELITLYLNFINQHICLFETIEELETVLEQDPSEIIIKYKL